MEPKTLIVAAIFGLIGGFVAYGVVHFLTRSQNQGPGRVAALSKRLQEAEHRLRLVEDRAAIMNLQRAYGYYLDKAMYDDLVALFTDDVSLEYSGRGVYLGKDRAEKLMKMMPGGEAGLEHGMLQNHMQLQGVVHVAPDGQTAKGRWRTLMMYGRWGETAMWGEGPYEMEYRKEDGIWKISKLHWYVTVQTPYDKGWHKETVPFPRVSEDFPPDKPPSEVYEAYPGVYVPPFHYANPVTNEPSGGGSQ